MIEYYDEYLLCDCRGRPNSMVYRITTQTQLEFSLLLLLLPIKRSPAEDTSTKLYGKRRIQ